MPPLPVAEPLIRPAQATDAAACAALVLRLSPAFYVDPAGAGTEAFQASVAAAQQARCIAEYRYWVAEAQGQLVGLAALRPPGHVFHLFVAAEWQGLGLGSRLLQQLMQGLEGQALSVNASLAARAFYARHGFVPQGPALAQDGVRFQPMRREPL